MKKLYMLFLLVSTFLLNKGFSENPPCSVQAGFTTAYLNNQLNVVQCFNSSIVDSTTVVYSIWNFGDGTPSVNTSGLSQPSHTYTTSGLYNICLKVISVIPGTTSINCADSICHQVQVQAPTTCTLTSNFTSTVSSNVAAFQNTSTGYAAGDSIRWTFGDGNVAYDLNPTHTFANPGTYTVCLRIRKNPTPAGSTPCVSEVCHTVAITASNPCNLYPNFTAALSPNTNNVYVFTNTSTPASSTASITWNFGDSTFGSGNVVTHSYAQSGVYRVCMTVVVNNTCIRDTCITLTVNNPVPPACSISPRFSVTPSPSQPGLFLFNNTTFTTVAMAVVWSFGDSTTATGNSVSHAYTQSGVYTVCMQVSTNNNTCVRDTCGTVVVNIPTPQPCSVHAGFNTTYVNNQLNVIHCLNTSIADTNSIVYSIWNFGDGTPSVSTSGLSQPTHTYTASGLYNICLKVISVVPGTTSVNCADSICHQIQVQVSTACTLTANFTSAVSSNVATFQNTSTGFAAGDSIRWTFGDGSVSYDLNPAHTFANPGTYTVCLRIAHYIPGAIPCVSEVCHTVTITAQNPCSLYPNFTATSSPNTNNVYVFTNTSTPASSAASVTWNFGDSTFGSGNMVTHSYSQSGVYRVCMTVVVNNTCMRDTCITLTVNNPVPPVCSVVPRFSVTSPINSQPGQFYFTNISTVSTTSGMNVIWSFGDSTTATGNNVSHVYTHSGNYNVCMHVSVNNNTCASDTCVVINVNLTTPPPSTCTLTPSFNISRNTATNNNFEFINTTTGMGANTIVVWNFGDGTSDTGNIAHHTYAQNGSYNVCMNVIDSTCSRTVCRFVSTSNYLQAYPNPAQSYVNVNINLSQSTPIYAYVYNSQGMLVGQLLQQGMLGNNLLTFNVAALPAGYYTIRIYTANEVFISRFQKL